MLALGGDHFITLPILCAYAKHHGEMALIHFDAHTDTYENGSNYDHGFNVINAMLANDQSAEEIVTQIRSIVGDKPAYIMYITFDIDCLDPAFAPGTGTPVCGGLNSDKALKIIRGLAGINVVGIDVVEVSPPYDHSELTALAGTTIALELLYLWSIANSK